MRIFTGLCYELVVFSVGIRDTTQSQKRNSDRCQLEEPRTNTQCFETGFSDSISSKTIKKILPIFKTFFLISATELT